MIRRMKVLVIGGTAFMGRAIVERLVRRRHEVSVLHRRDRHDLDPEVRNLQADRADLQAVTAILGREQFEAVFDLAYDWQRGTPAGHIEAAARAAGDRLHRYVFMSSIAAYGPGLDRAESDPLAPEAGPDAYTTNKASAERALFRMHRDSGFPIATFRPPFVHGPRQPFYREQFFWDRMADGRPLLLPDGGDQPMQWAFVDDVAEACVRALEVPEAAGEAFNVAHVERTTQRTFLEALGRAAGVEPILVPMPRAEIGAAGGQLIGSNLYFGEVLDLPAHTEVVEKAPRLLGVTPTRLDDALAASYAWYRTEPRRPVDYAFEDRLLGS
jgi:nucleoside-diphosphate-sugar epimerase